MAGWAAAWAHGIGGHEAQGRLELTAERFPHSVTILSLRALIGHGKGLRIRRGDPMPAGTTLNRAGPKELPDGVPTISMRLVRRNQGGHQMKSPIHSVESAGTGMIFVEGFRLLFVLAGSVAGFEIGRSLDGQSTCPGGRAPVRSRSQLRTGRGRRPPRRQGTAARGVPLPQYPSRRDVCRLDHRHHRDAPRIGDRAPPPGSPPVRLRPPHHRGHRLGAGHPGMEARLRQGQAGRGRRRTVRNSWPHNPTHPGPCPVGRLPLP